MESLYGNEWKDRLEDRLTPEQAAALAEVLAAPDPLVLNISQWHCTTGWQVPPRRIGDSLILIVKSGRVQVRIEDGEAILESGGCALIPENALHCYELAPGCEACTNYVLHLLPLQLQAEHLFSGFSSLFRKLRHPEAFFEQLELGIALRNSSRQRSAAFVGSLIRILEREAILAGEFRGRAEGGIDPRIGRALEFIYRNHTAALSVADIAATAGLKEVQFRRVFLRVTGMTPAVYLHRQRLLHAVRLLLRESAGVREIAEQSGFQSASYFCSSFRKFYRVSPEEFRRAHL